MPPPQLVPDADIQALRAAAVSAGLASSLRRIALMADVMPQFVATIPEMVTPADQINVDLRKLNEVTSLPNGTVPLQQWLRTAADLTFGRPETKTFQAVYMKLAATQATPNRAVSDQPKNAGGKEIAIGRNDLLTFGFLDQGSRAGKAVAKALIGVFENNVPVKTALDQQETTSGTAWLLSATLALTNHHVINARKPGVFASAGDFTLQAQHATLQFDFDFQDAVGETLAVDDCVIADTTLDFALIRLKVDSKRAPLTVAGRKLSLDDGKPVAVNIIQHANGLAKQIGIRNNLVNEVTDTQISYFTDTMYGSSGSAVCNDQWQVLALHSGYEEVTNVVFQGKPTAFVNYGAPILDILGHIRAKRPAVWDEIRAAQPSLAGL